MIASSRRPQPPPYRTVIFHYMLVTSSYAQITIILSFYVEITLVTTHEVGHNGHLVLPTAANMECVHNNTLFPTSGVIIYQTDRKGFL